MFTSSREFPFFDYMRIPYLQGETTDAGSPPAGIGRLQLTAPSDETSPTTLWWWSRDGHLRRGDVRTGRFRIGDIWIVGQVCLLHPAETVGGDDWSLLHDLTDTEGISVGGIWTNARGSIYVPFDPSELMHNLWSERYLSFGRSATTQRVRRAVVRSYYAVRPILPRRLQLRLRRVFASHQRIPEFPAWPIDQSLHDLCDLLLDLVTRVAGQPVPWLDPWPDGRSWAMVLTHDVETESGRDSMELLRAAERERGYRSSWNFVPERYDVSADLLTRIRKDDCEVGLHGLRHDGRDLASRRMVARRRPAMRAAADEWGAVGFRAPATQRGWDLMPMLGMEYDSSYTDTDPYEPQPGGCCTYWPFFNRELVELPITLPQDHTLFEILGHDDGELWLTKARLISNRGGMVLVLAHPDYATDGRLAAAWTALLDEFADDETAWRALPSEVASWWRERATTEIQRMGDEWQLAGPAAQRGRIRFTTPAPSVAARQS